MNIELGLNTEGGMSVTVLDRILFERVPSDGEKKAAFKRKRGEGYCGKHQEIK